MNVIDYSVCPSNIIAKQVVDALTEDLSLSGDVTASLIRNNHSIIAMIKTNEDMIMCGKEWFNRSFHTCDTEITIDWYVNEGDSVTAGTVLCKVIGNARAILTAERTALNFVQILSATATLVRKYVDIVATTQVKVLDTRKTIPGLRLAQKYAVTVGGGYNQRVGLYDGVLIKENHIMACGGINAVLSQAFAVTPKHIPIQIEVEDLHQLDEAIEAGAQHILLDNMSLKEIKECVNFTNGRAELEVSGNVSLDNILSYAETGVDRISVGALTKNVKAIDLSMRVDI